MALKRRQVVRKSGRRPSQSKGEPSNLANAPLDAAALGTQTYLTIPELCVYARLQTKKSAYCLLDRLGVRWAARRVNRREFDRAWERAAEKRHVA